MLTQKRIYLATTVLFSLAMAAGGVFDLLRSDDLAQAMAHLGYPAYLMTILGIWKLLGVVALWLPGRERLREWAYAGFFFDLSGAVLSHMAVGDGPGQWSAPALMLGLGMLSWRLRPGFRGGQG